MSGEIVSTSGPSAGVPSSQEIARLEHIANNLAGSGLFKDATAAKQAFAKMMYGRDLGLSPTAAMTAIHVVEGKPELSANLQAQMVNSYEGPAGERYRYRVVDHDLERCAIEFSQREVGGEWELIGTAVYTMEDAQRAGLTNRGPWKKHPRNMLWARAMSDGVNFYCPEVARGLRVFHEGEIGGEMHTAPAPEEVDAEPVVSDAVQLLGAGEKAEQLAEACDAARRSGIDGIVTMLTNFGAFDDSSMRALCASLPADRVPEVEAWLGERMVGVEA